MFRKPKDESGALASYKVTYKGGIAGLPKPKIGEIRLEIHADRFEMLPSSTTKKWWEPLTLPYDTITDVQIVDRSVSTFEALAGGLNSRQLNQKNVIEILYGSDQLLRLEMLSSVTVMGQAKKCIEFMDLLRAHKVRSQFRAMA